jgi:superfamily II DNA/RNA helicase
LSFASLALHEKLQQALLAAGYETPTPVQAEAIPAVLAGHDLIVSAQTGTGKTAAFMLPALSRIANEPRKEGRGPRVLVLTPTRELAQQVTAACQKYGSQLKGLNTVSVLGGMPFPLQNRMLSRPYDILVATPGRLIDHMERGRITFDRLEMLILDEADRMLDMGFIEDVELIASKTPPERQTLLFSATIESRISSLAGKLLRNPKRIEISAQTVRNENISQRVYFADDLDHKKKLLLELLTSTEINQAIIFAGTRVDSDALADELSGFGHAVDALHGDMKQAARNRTLNSLRQGRTRLLVATDVAARGIDVPGITHVINYDLPKSAEDYVHRIGRTGRAGRAGQAVSLVGPRDRSVLRRIEQFTDQRIEVAVLAGLEPRRSTEDRPRRPAGANDKPRWGSKDRQTRDARSERSNSRESFAPRREPGNEAFPRREPGNFAPRPDYAPRADAAPRREGGFPPRREGGFAPRPDTGNSYAPRRDAGFAPAGRRDDRGPRSDSPRGRDDSRRPAGAGFSRPQRSEYPVERVAEVPQEVAVSYARPRRARPENETRPTTARRPASDSFFEERP